MTLSLYQTTSAAAGYRKSLEGWARAGIKLVELTNTALDEFLKTSDLPAARRVLTDLGLTAVQGAVGVTGLWEPNPNRAAAFEELKRRCEMYAQLGLKAVYATTVCNSKISADDYKPVPDHLRAAGEIATVPVGFADRVRAVVDVHFNPANTAHAHAGGGASKRVADARLLSLLDRFEQDGRP